MKFKIQNQFLILVFILFLSSCAFDIVRVDQIPTQLSSDPKCLKEIVLTKNIIVGIGSGYKRTLKKGTRWFCIGSIKQGDVFKTKDQILTIEASNIYEANIVVVKDNLIGFYLPVEHSFSSLKTPVRIFATQITE